MKQAICLLCKMPNPIWLNFLENFKNYDIFIIIDDNDVDYNEIYASNYTNLKLIQIQNEICYQFNYTNCNSAVGFPNVIAWDKAIYLMNEIEKTYEYIWFIEDDVFISDENVIINIDKQHTSVDLLSAFHDTNNSDDINKMNEWWNHWVNIIHKIHLPWAHSMVCACRVSRKLLQKVNEYKNKLGTLFFIEAMFNTIAMQNELSIQNPRELETIHWNTRWDISKIDFKNLYHPIKNISYHQSLRQIYNLNK
jgi:hypothetical protein